MDNDDEDLAVTNFSELRTYVADKVIKSNYEGFKRYLKYKKATFEKCFRRRGKQVDPVLAGEMESSKLQEGMMMLKPSSAVQKTRFYIQERKERFIGSALEYYLRLCFKLNERKIDFDFVKELIACGCDVNHLGEANESLLFLAVRHEHEELVQYLLDKDVSVRQTDSQGCNIFHVAAMNQSPSVMRRLAQKFNSEELEQLLAQRSVFEQQTPLHHAAKEGSCDIVECLVTELSVNKEAKDSKNRTALFIAAEFNRKKIVQFLMKQKCCVSFVDDSNKKETLNNINGQTALYWIVTKMPDIAKEALDLLYEPNQYLRKDKHYLAALEPKLMVSSCGDNVALPKSVLTTIVESANLDLIVHPTINCLIEIKWKKFARKRAWFDFLLTIVYVTVWIAFGVWVPYNDRHSYDFSNSADRFRFSLFIIGILFTVYLVITEIKEVLNEYRYQQKSNRLRQAELQEYKESFKQVNEKSHFIKEEESFIRQNNKLKVIYNYLSDTWNLYDWASIILLFACIGTHLDDMVKHSEAKARLHIRIMSITIIIISIRLLKSSRIIIPKFGTLVMILYYSIADMVIWFILYLVIWLSFSCSFWMIYGGVKFSKDIGADSECFEFNNCTTVSFERFETYDLTAYTLYRLTFGEPFDEDQLNQIDDRMLNPLIGSYVGITSLVLVNIFIALLSATFQRVYEKAGAYIRLQRGIEILNKEKSMTYEERKDHIEYLHRIGTPYIDHRFNETITTLEDRVLSLEKEGKEHNKLLTTINNSFENTNSVTRNYISFNNDRLNKLQTDVREMKEAMKSFLEVQMHFMDEIKRTENEATKKPKFDYLNYRDFSTKNE